jgi:hypothetical protein
MARRRRKDTDYALLSITINGYDVRTDAGIHFDLSGPRRHLADPDAPVFTFRTDLTLRGVCSDPPERAGERFEIDLTSGHEPSRHLRLRIEHLQERDQHDNLIFRKYGDGQWPVYADPRGHAVLEKTRGPDMRWTAWMEVAPQMVTDTLALLACGRQLYLSVHEQKIERRWWVRNLSVQTADPARE